MTPQKPSDSGLDIRPLDTADRQTVIGLWHQCGLTRPWNDPDTDIDLAIRCPSSTILVGVHGATIIATAMAGFDGHRGWVYYLAVHPDAAGKGYGRAMMRAAEDWLLRHGAPKLELMVRDGNDAALGFYEALGYEPQKVAVLAKWLDDRDR